MDKADIVQLIRDRLGFNDALTEAIILRNMDFIQNFYEKGNAEFPVPWFLFDPDVTASTVAAQPYVSFPTDFIQWEDNWPFWVTNSAGLNSVLKPVKGYQAEGHNETDGSPTEFALGGTQVRLYPTPDAVYTIHLPCFKSSEALSTATTSPWFSNFPTFVIEETIYSICKATRDIEGMKLTGIESTRRSYFKKVVEMQNVMMDYTKGTYDA